MKIYKAPFLLAYLGIALDNILTVIALSLPPKIVGDYVWKIVEANPYFPYNILFAVCLYTLGLLALEYIYDRNKANKQAELIIGILIWINASYSFIAVVNNILVILTHLML